MNVKIIKPPEGGVVRAIASKSEAHRLLICAGLADTETFVGCPESSEDIDATARCLAAMGATVEHTREGYSVSPVDRSQISKLECGMDCGESGSTLRFILPVCGALGIRASIQMGGRLPERPLSALYEEMTAHGCRLSAQGVNPLICEGRLRSGKYTIPGNISSQFVSGLLFALPLLEGDSIIQVAGVLESRPYVDITLDVLRAFGVEVTEMRNAETTLIRNSEFGIRNAETGVAAFHVFGGRVFRSPGVVRAGGDWSNAAFWFSLGAICQGGVTCIGLDPDSRQGDRAVLPLLERFGADIKSENGAVTVSPGTLRGIDIDAGDTPDLVPALAAVACVAEGRTTIRNAGRLRIKESDRLRTVAETFSNLGADIKETEDGIEITGKKRLTGGSVISFGDHRIAMSAAILSAACTGPVVIEGAEAVRKSYPGFFDDFKTLGGDIIIQIPSTCGRN